MSNENKEVLKAELEDGYGRVANLLLEALSMSKLNGKQMSICLFIIRRTYSWGKKSDEITLKEFALACDSSETYMSKQLKQLIEWKVIKRKNYSPGKIPEYEINTRVDEWDKGCLNIQGLNENIRQGLYNQARVPLNKRTRVDQGQAIENTDVEGCSKENIKENIKKDIITTTNINNQLSETGNNDPVADMDADSIQQDDLVAPIGAGPTKQVNPVQKIERVYLQIRKRPMCSSKDLGDIVEAYEKYKDTDFIIRVMKTASEENKTRNGRLTINSFSYFMPIFEEEWNKQKAREKGGKHGSTPRNSRKNFKFDKSQFLWNGGENPL